VEVVFGWFLDSAAFPETVSGQPSAFNSVVCGPNGLLSLLETKLGIGPASTFSGVRIAEAIIALEKIDNNQQFYSASFKVDPWSTATHLLSIRDELVAGGWNYLPIENILKTKVFSAMQSLLTVPGAADRLRLVVETIEEVSERLIQNLNLVTPRNLLPWQWQQIIDALEAAGTSITQLDRGASSPNCDLAKVKQALSTRAKCQKLSGDGTCVILDADDEIQASEVAAHWLAKQVDRMNLVIIRDQRNSIFDEACHQHGLPRIGTASSSAQRGILQVLPLSFEISWTPFHAARCLEFLSLAGCPIPKFVANTLKRVLVRQPGLGGSQWQAAWTDILSDRIESLRKRGSHHSESNLQEEAQIDVQTWKDWFEPIQLESGCISASSITKTCERVNRWATARANTDGNSLYLLAAKHASALSAVVKVLGSRFLSVHQLKHMLNTVISEGVSDTAHGAEACEWSVVNSPGQIWGPAKITVWLGFSTTMPNQHPRDFWTSAELLQLIDSKVTIDRTSNKIQRLAATWHKPFENTQERVLIVKSRTTAGQPTFNHPVWDELLSLIDKIEIKKITVSAETVFRQKTIDLASNTLSSEPISHQKLPSPLRDWIVPEKIIVPRVKESFTSLDRLFGCSLAWTLEYSAKIRSGSLASMSQNDRIMGDFAHTIVSELLSNEEQFGDAQKLRIRTAALIDERLPQMASVLLLPGNKIQLRKNKDALLNSVVHLIGLLTEANLKVDGTEQTFTAPFNLGEFAGTIDLLVKTTEGLPVVLDLKWSRYPSVYKQKLAQGKALQLASYAWLLSQQKGAISEFPWVGFYMLRQAHLYTNSLELSPQYAISATRSIADTWTYATEQYNRIFGELQIGHPTATGIAPDAGSETFIEPPCTICSFGDFCGIKESTNA
jgi:ATP-dependent helicase/nuclease subunit B